MIRDALTRPRSLRSAHAASSARTFAARRHRPPRRVRAPSSQRGVAGPANHRPCGPDAGGQSEPRDPFRALCGGTALRRAGRHRAAARAPSLAAGCELVQLGAGALVCQLCFSDAFSSSRFKCLQVSCPSTGAAVLGPVARRKLRVACVSTVLQDKAGEKDHSSSRRRGGASSA